MESQRIIDTFIELCRLPAVSGNEAASARVCRKALEELGFTVVEDKAGEAFGGNQGNLIAWLDGDADIPPLLLNSHLDTVEPGGIIEPVIVQDRIQSKGNTILGADNRAGLVMILEGLRCFRKANPNHGPIEVVLTVAEEAGLLGAENMDFSMIRSKAGFSLDSSGLGRLGIGAPFYNAIDVQVIGRSAHAAVNADQGINSIQLMAQALAPLHFGKLDEETTSNIGQIQGGVARNVVPASCQAVMEVRSHNLETLNQQTALICQAFTDLAESHAVVVDGIPIKPVVDVTVNRECDGFYLDETVPVVQCASTVLRSLGRTVGCYRNMGGSDANVFNSHGLEVVVVGTGQTAVHSYEEYIKIKDLIDGVRLIPALIQQWTDWWSQNKT